MKLNGYQIVNEALSDKKSRSVKTYMIAGITISAGIALAILAVKKRTAITKDAQEIKTKILGNIAKSIGSDSETLLRSKIKVIK